MDLFIVSRGHKEGKKKPPKWIIFFFKSKKYFLTIYFIALYVGLAINDWAGIFEIKEID